MNNVVYSDADIKAYFGRLIGKVYKVLPICENSYETKNSYIESLVRELTGSLQTSNDAFHRAEFMTVINTLLYLSTLDKYNPKVYRSEIFKCIRIIKKVGGLDEV